MTDYEFKTQMQRLSDAFPSHYSSQQRTKLIFERVKDLDLGWFRKLVDRIILTNDPRFNFDEASRGERLARKQINLTTDLIRASEAISEQITDQGFANALAEFGTNSLLDAVFKKRGNTDAAK